MINQGGYGVVIGVLSFSQPVDCSPTDFKCFMNYNCNINEVAVYTRVSPYIPWIKNTTGLGMPCPPGFVITYGSYDHIAGKGSYSKNQKDIFACANECKKKGKRSCCSFEWSESAGLCKLHQGCKNDQTRFADFFTCRKEAHGCSLGFELMDGDAKGNGFKQMKNVSHGKCSFNCLTKKDCCSYEYSPEKKMCNLNKECEPTEGKVEDFLFCKKESTNSTSKFDPTRLARPTLLNRYRKSLVLSELN